MNNTTPEAQDFRFEIRGDKYAIGYTFVDEAVACSEYISDGDKWQWVYVNTAGSVKKGTKSVDEFLDEFLIQLNAILDTRYSGEIPPPNWDTPEQELTYKIQYGLELVDERVRRRDIL